MGEASSRHAQEGSKANTVRRYGDMTGNRRLGRTPVDTQCEITLDGSRYELSFDANQLRRRRKGDLITAEITAVSTQQLTRNEESHGD